MPLASWPACGLYLGRGLSLLIGVLASVVSAPGFNAAQTQLSFSQIPLELSIDAGQFLLLVDQVGHNIQHLIETLLKWYALGLW